MSESESPSRKGPHLALITSVALEAEPVRRRLHHMRERTVGRKPAWEGLLGGVKVLLLEGGMGKTNAAQMLSAALETQTVDGVIGFGVGGGYPDSALDAGDVALASGEIYGDEGVDTLAGWLSTEGIGIPLLRTAEGPCFNQISLPPARVAAASEALTRAGLSHTVGPFVTVSTCSGTAARGEELANRFSAIVETMEGAAYAHVAALYEKPFVEVRGVSNRVEDRDLSRWRLSEAAEAAATAVVAVARDWRRITGAVSLSSSDSSRP